MQPALLDLALEPPVVNSRPGPTIVHWMRGKELIPGVAGRAGWGAKIVPQSRRYFWARASQCRRAAAADVTYSLLIRITSSAERLLGSSKSRKRRLFLSQGRILHRG